MSEWKPYLFLRGKELLWNPDKTLRTGGYKAYIKAPAYNDLITGIPSENLAIPENRASSKILITGSDHIFVGEAGLLANRLGKNHEYALDERGKDISYTFGFVAPKGTPAPSLSMMEELDKEMKAELDRLVSAVNQEKPLETDFGKVIAERSGCNYNGSNPNAWDKLAYNGGIGSKDSMVMDLSNVSEKNIKLASLEAKQQFAGKVHLTGKNLARIASEKAGWVPWGIGVLGVAAASSLAYKIHMDQERSKKLKNSIDTWEEWVSNSSQPQELNR